MTDYRKTILVNSHTETTSVALTTLPLRPGRVMDPCNRIRRDRRRTQVLLRPTGAVRYAGRPGDAPDIGAMDRHRVRLPARLGRHAADVHHRTGRWWRVGASVPPLWTGSGAGLHR